MQDNPGVPNKLGLDLYLLLLGKTEVLGTGHVFSNADRDPIWVFRVC